MRHIISIALLCIVFSSSVFAQKYSSYQTTTKLVTEMEWRLMKVNVPLSNSMSTQATFNSDDQRFEATSWVLTTDVQQVDTSTLRDRFVSVVNLASALLGGHFPEFDESGEDDLIIRFNLGLENYGAIAVYRTGRLNFTDSYYNYLKEIGKR